MEICEFQGRVFGKLKGHLFVFEFSWDNIRPIEYVGWNGTKFEIVDKKFKQNLFDPYYGYGSREMKLACNKLFKETEIEPRNVIINPTDFWKWCGHRTQWWRDRDCLFSSACVSPSVDAWKRLISVSNSKAKTLKQKVRLHSTRRVKGLVPK
jgi:hypothetical protein